MVAYLLIDFLIVPFSVLLNSKPIDFDGFKVVEFDHFPNCGDIAIIKIACKDAKNFPYMQIILHNYIKKRTIKSYLTVRFENHPLIERRTGVLRWKAFLSRS